MVTALNDLQGPGISKVSLLIRVTTHSIYKFVLRTFCVPESVLRAVDFRDDSAFASFL